MPWQIFQTEITQAFDTVIYGLGLNSFVTQEEAISIEMCYVIHVRVCYGTCSLGHYQSLRTSLINTARLSPKLLFLPFFRARLFGPLEAGSILKLTLIKQASFGGCCQGRKEGTAKHAGFIYRKDWTTLTWLSWFSAPNLEIFANELRKHNWVWSLIFVGYL